MTTKLLSQYARLYAYALSLAVVFLGHRYNNFHLDLRLCQY